MMFIKLPRAEVTPMSRPISRWRTRLVLRVVNVGQVNPLIAVTKHIGDVDHPKSWSKENCQIADNLTDQAGDTYAFFAKPFLLPLDKQELDNCQRIPANAIKDPISLRINVKFTDEEQCRRAADPIKAS